MRKWRLILGRQWLHVLLLAPMLGGLMAACGMDGVREGSLFGVATPSWFWVSAALPIAHQVYVWFCWRTQLHGRLLTQFLGESAFPLYAIGFAILGLLRVASVFALAISNRGTLDVDATFLRLLAVAAFIPSLYLFYSVARYFGFRRATGLDHFDETYRSKPFVRKGIFPFTRNGMYTFGFMLFWVPGLWYASQAALVVALFNHAYIWVHYFATERPDMRRIYRNDRMETKQG